MSKRLRPIALTVEQAGGAYGWLLIESTAGRVIVLKRAARSYSTYLAALDAGYQELALMSACGLHEPEPQDQQEATRMPRGIELAETHDAL